MMGVGAKRAIGLYRSCAPRHIGALGPVANTDTKLLIYGLSQKGRVLAQDGVAVRPWKT